MDRGGVLLLGRWVRKFVFITCGAMLMAVALELFLVPNAVLDGGVTGVSIIASKLTSWSLGALLFLFNIPFLLIGYKQIGRTFFFTTLYGIAVMSVSTALLLHHEPFTSDRMLAVLFGGLILGIGVGFVLRFGGALDGTEIVAVLISRRFGIPVGQVILFINLFIFGTAGFVFGWDTAMYSVFTYYIAYKVIDIVVEGMDESKSVTIISSHYDIISQAIMDRLGRNTTFIYARGGFSQEDTKMIFCVVSRLELAKLKAIVQSIDSKAFITIEHVADVLGANFKKKAIH